MVIVAGARERDIREVFTKLDSNGSSSLGITEFVTANMFSEEMLTERMLSKTFLNMDGSGMGKVTPFKLYQVLSRHDPRLQPEDICAFVGDSDCDWDKNISFEQFK